MWSIRHKFRCNTSIPKIITEGKVQALKKLCCHNSILFCFPKDAHEQNSNFGQVRCPFGNVIYLPLAFEEDLKEGLHGVHEKGRGKQGKWSMAVGDEQRRVTDGN